MSNSTKCTRGGLLKTAAGAAAGTLLSTPTALAAKGPKRPLPPLLDSKERLELPGFQPIREKTIWPANGCLDLSRYHNLWGYIGLQPDLSGIDQGEVTLWYYADQAGEKITGVQGLPLTNLIISNAILGYRNQGSFLKLEFEPFHGNCRLSFRLFGSNRKSDYWLIPPDNMLVTERDIELPVGPPHTWYPADYWVGEMVVDFQAPAGFTTTLWGADLTFGWYPIRSGILPGNWSTVSPFGTFAFLVYNDSGKMGKYSLTVTPNLGKRSDEVKIPQHPRRLAARH